MPTLSMSRLDKPLRHSIAAILDKCSPPPSPSSCCYDGSSGVCYLPQTALLPLVVPNGRAPLSTTAGSDVTERAHASGRVNDAPGRDETTTREPTMHTMLRRSWSLMENDGVITAGHVTDELLSADDKDDRKSVLASPPFAAKGIHPLLPSRASGGTVTNHLSMMRSPYTADDTTPAVKSAFRPIVRPWIAGGSVKKTAEQLPMVSARVLKSAKPFPLCPARKAPMESDHVTRPPFAQPSLDAVVLFRQQSSAFRAVCRSEQEASRQQPVTNRTSGVQLGMAAGVIGCGHPMASSLSSWLSWLQTRGLHLGSLFHHPGCHHHQHQQQQQQRPNHGLQQPLPLQTLTTTGVALSCQQAPRYNCEACGKSYSTFGGLSKHKQFHCAAQVKKDFRCKFCDKNYSSLGALKMHIRTHTLPCKCGVCGKAFSRPWLLQGHVRTHTGEKPFTCPHCARAFADRSNLRAHLQTHSEVKKYSCRSCSKTFSRMSLLTKHRESTCAAFQR
ncbi:zinc finger protein Gfi-1b-like [Pomacea canaliculata]|nr:zinc finger protein Gfi-1b-like [Pomacea canaliculata]